MGLGTIQKLREAAFSIEAALEATKNDEKKECEYCRAELRDAAERGDANQAGVSVSSRRWNS